MSEYPFPGLLSEKTQVPCGVLACFTRIYGFSGPFSGVNVPCPHSAELYFTTFGPIFQAFFRNRQGAPQ